VKSIRKPRKAADLTYDRQQFSPSDAAETIMQRKSRQFPWGYYARDYDSWGSGALFFWFASTDEMLAFIAEVQPHVYFEVRSSKCTSGTRANLRRQEVAS